VCIEVGLSLKAMQHSAIYELEGVGCETTRGQFGDHGLN